MPVPILPTKIWIITINLCEISSWYHGLLIRVNNSEIQNNVSNMTEWYNKNK